MAMGRRGIRIGLAVMFLTAFLLSYSMILIDMMSTYIVDPYDMQKYLIRIYILKVMVFSTYCVTNSVMLSNYKSQFEKEVLLTGIFSIIFITLQTALHYSHILIMSSQMNLILFNGMTMAFFLLVYWNGKKHKLFNGQ